MIVPTEFQFSGTHFYELEKQYKEMFCIILGDSPFRKCHP